MLEHALIAHSVASGIVCKVISQSKGHFSCADSLSLIRSHGKNQTWSFVINAKGCHFRFNKVRDGGESVA